MKAQASGNPSVLVPRTPSQDKALESGVEPVKRRMRLLVADSDTPFARRLSNYFWENGFESRVAGTAGKAKDLIEIWRPDIVFMDLLLPDASAMSIFKFINHNRNGIRKAPKVVVMSRYGQPKGIDQIFKAGASLFMIKPFSLEDAFRAVAEIYEQTKGRNKDRRAKSESTGTTALREGPGTLKELHLLNLFLKQASQGGQSEENLYKLMRMISMKVHGVRVSMIQCLSGHHGRVLASNDNEGLHDLHLDLRKYPEILEMQRTLEPVVIPNIQNSDLMAGVRSRVAQAPFSTLVVFPIFRCGTLFGALSIRLEQRDALEIFYVEKFGQICAQIISLAIGTEGQRLIDERN